MIVPRMLKSGPHLYLCLLALLTLLTLLLLAGPAVIWAQPAGHVSAPCDPSKFQSGTTKDLMEAASKLGDNSPNPQAKECVPALINLLQAERRKLQAQARERAQDEERDKAQGKKQDKPTPTPKPLLDTLPLQTFINTLGRIGPPARDAVPSLIAVLREQTLGNDGDQNLREKAIKALERIGAGAEDAIPALTEMIDSEDENVREDAAEALSKIAVGLLNAGDASHIEQLKAARGKLSGSTHSRVHDQAATVETAINGLEAGRAAADHMAGFERPTEVSPFVPRWLSKSVSDHPWRIVLLSLLPLLLLCWLLLLRLRPLWLLRVNEALAAHEVELPAWAGGFKLPLRHASLVGFFHHHPRVLDAWVAKYAYAARKNFFEKETVEARVVHVPVPVNLDDRSLPGLSPADLRPLFAKNAARLLIQGEGGSGKTSLACLLARWALAEEAGERLCPTHRMLPVLVEPDYELKANEGENPFLEFVKDQLKGLIDESEPLSPALLVQLLRRRRVLLIVDSMSEMDDEARQHLIDGITDFANAVIVTSRADEPMNSLPKSVLRPVRIATNRLSNFLGAYLTHRGKRDLFDDDEFTEAYRDLSLIIGGRAATPLLAKYYAEHLIAAKEGQAGVADTPQNIPELMVEYVYVLYRMPRPELAFGQLILAAKSVAWECLRGSFRPASARREDVLTALGGDSLGLLKHMEETLKIIQTVGVARDRVKFAFDPLAEYLAGLHLVHTYADGERAWRDFLRRADEQPGSPESIKGFLMALQDCCESQEGQEAAVPAFVHDELRRRITLNAADDEAGMPV